MGQTEETFTCLTTQSQTGSESEVQKNNNTSRRKNEFAQTLKNNGVQREDLLQSVKNNDRGENRVEDPLPLWE